MRDNLHGNTPLHWALLAKNLNAVTSLVSKYNADIQAVNLQGMKKEINIIFHIQVQRRNGDGYFRILDSQIGCIGFCAELFEKKKL